MLIVGNLKMNKTHDEMEEYKKTLEKSKSYLKEVVICPSHIYLETLKSNDFILGAQDCSRNENGSFTGEISAVQLKSSGIKYVIIGHSERRKYHDESNQTINSKVKLALKAGLFPIVCVGETADEKNMHQTTTVIKRQVIGALKNIAKDDAEDICFAYEPRWAIGSGKIPTSSQISETISYIKKIVAVKFEVNIKVLYGGSAKMKNIRELNKIKEIDGYLIGGASLEPQGFLKLISEINNK